MERREDELFEGDEVLVTATSGFESYKLLLNNKVVQMSGPNHSIAFLAEIGFSDIQVFATDANGCTSEDFLRIWIDSKKLPNVLTPNLDGKNDIFLEGYLREGDTLEVFNRAGLKLYSGHEGWDGYYNGRIMPQGTYLYVVKRRMSNGEIRIFKGEVTLIH
jgi:gliding motility-associated-like protein